MLTQLLRFVLTFTLAFGVFGKAFGQTDAGRVLHLEADHLVYIPVVFGPASPAGVYNCNEYEFGLIWRSGAITLSADGKSVYAIGVGTVTGTWVYTPAVQEVGFTNFGWLTATFQSPNSLYVSKYLPEPGFSIALSCGKR